MAPCEQCWTTPFGQACRICGQKIDAPECVMDSLDDLTQRFDPIAHRSDEEGRRSILEDLECPRCGAVRRSRYVEPRMPRCGCVTPLTPMRYRSQPWPKQRKEDHS